MATVEDEVHSSSVSVVYIVRLRIVFSKAALQERGSVEPMEPATGETEGKRRLQPTFQYGR